MSKEIVKKLINFIKDSPTCFHAVKNMKNILKSENFIELLEGQTWKLEKGKNYFVTRNNSSIIAFKIGEDIKNYSFNIVASHTDSPTFKLKENAEISVDNKYIKLNTEGYGGMIVSSWFDKPLSLAGRVFINRPDGIFSTLVKIDKDLLLIPSLAIHISKDMKASTDNKQIDLLPLISQTSKYDGKNLVNKILALELNIDPDDIISRDIFLYNRTPGTIWGANEEFFSCPQIDNLECAFTSLLGFINGYNSKSIDVYASFDNEEVGSETKQGALSTFLFDVLNRINENLSYSKEDYYKAISSSFMISADNAHSFHPNHKELTDDTNYAYMNGGIVIKSHAGQKYTSDGQSISVFKKICKDENIPLQFFSNRSDKIGGSTLGNLSQNHVSLNTVDIGLAQLSMHSTYETAGVKDAKYMVDAIEAFYKYHFKTKDNFTFEFTK